MISIILSMIFLIFFGAVSGAPVKQRPYTTAYNNSEVVFGYQLPADRFQWVEMGWKTLPFAPLAFESVGIHDDKPMLAVSFHCVQPFNGTIPADAECCIETEQKDPQNPVPYSYKCRTYHYMGASVDIEHVPRLFDTDELPGYDLPKDKSGWIEVGFRDAHHESGYRGRDAVTGRLREAMGFPCRRDGMPQEAYECCFDDYAKRYRIFTTKCRVYQHLDSSNMF
ncbi:hypothetical protein MMC25_006410 [Agyrium rufum]|nr:hypothetical protein [Agyrium rufum]